MSDIIFPVSYVVFSMSDVVLRTLGAAAFAWNGSYRVGHGMELVIISANIEKSNSFA